MSYGLLGCVPYLKLKSCASGFRNPWTERLYSDPRWFGVRRDSGKALFYHLFWGPAVGATWYITVGRHPRLGLQQSSKRGGIPNNPRPILVVGRTKSLWGISSLLTSNLTICLFIDLFTGISCFTTWCYILWLCIGLGKRDRVCVCVYWAFKAHGISCQVTKRNS